MVAGLIVLLVVAYVLFLVYRVYFYEPHGSSYSSSSDNSWTALPMVIFTLVLAGMTIEFARSEWRRSLGVYGSAWKIRAFTVVLIVIPVLVSPLAPTTLVFALCAVVLGFMDLLLGRSFVSKAAKKKADE